MRKKRNRFRGRLVQISSPNCFSVSRKNHASPIYIITATLKYLLAPGKSPGPRSFLLKVGRLLPKQTAARQSVWLAPSFVDWITKEILESLFYRHKTKGQDGFRLTKLQAFKPSVSQENSPPEP
jgi:hypothetical protein